MKIILLYNPTAGTENFDLDEVKDSLEKQGAKVRAQNTKDEDYLNVFKNSHDLVIVAGGDGTVGKILLELHDSNIPIALLPYGNANNIAGSLGIKGSHQNLIKNFEQENFTKLSVGKFETEEGSGGFIEGIGWGLFTAFLLQIERGKKEEADTGKKVEFGNKNLRKLPKELPVQDYEIQIDGKDYSGKYLWIEIMNIRQLGPRLVLAPKAHYKDEFLDVMLIKENQLDELRDYLKDHEKEDVVSPFKTIKAKSIRIKTHLPFHTDDSVFEHKSLYEGVPEVKINLQKHQLTILQTENESPNKP